MRILWTLVSLLFISTILEAAKKPEIPNLGAPQKWDARTESLVRQRLAHMDLPFDFQADDQVVNQIRHYLVNGYHETQAMLGRSKFYFPIFEHQLQQAGLPRSLKYIPVIETGLRPVSISPVGARGMWQMMRASAKFGDLKIDGERDERFDVYKSSAGAAKLLTYLHTRFDDWALAIAAYNAGHGRVLQAVRRANCPEYNFVKPYLPTETRQYLVRFIAAAYVDKHFADHGLAPVGGDAWSDIRVVKIHQYLNFREVARVTGVDYQKLRKLNPAMIKGYLPHDLNGNYLVIPAHGVEKLQNYLAVKNEWAQDIPDENAVRITYVVNPGDDLQSIASMFQVAPETIIKWNYMKDHELVPHQPLGLYLSRAYLASRA